MSCRGAGSLMDFAENADDTRKSCESTRREVGDRDIHGNAISIGLIEKKNQSCEHEMNFVRKIQGNEACIWIWMNVSFNSGEIE